MKKDRSLNKNRLKYSKILLLLTIAIAVKYNSQFALFTDYSFIAHIIGLLFVLMCILGRIYSTAFLGGYKASEIISHGPFSIVRNPLYIFSFLGVLGLSFMSNNLIILGVAPLAFMLIYYPVIVREEAFLAQHFGQVYKDYCQNVNRVIPSFKNYKENAEVICAYKPFESAFKDSTIWIFGIIVFYSLSNIAF